MQLSTRRRTTRERLVDVAAERFLDEGLTSVTLEDVAAAAGVHRATLHRAFPGGRDELVAAVVSQRFLELLTANEAWLDRLGGPRQAVTEIIVTAVVAARDDPLRAAALQTPAGRGALQDASSPLPERLTELWRILADATRDAGLEGLESHDPGRVIDHVLRTVMGLALDPTAPQRNVDLRAYVNDFVTPALVHPKQPRL